MQILQRFVTAAKRVARRLLPVPVHRWINRRRMRRSVTTFDGLPNRAVFSKIYAGSGYWGNSGDVPLTSGEGTSSAEVTGPYLAAVRELLEAFDHPPDVVDLGCGDFTVGSRVRPLCGRYIACDVVPDVLESNRSRYADLDVEFMAVDIAEDDLPEGGVVFLRQVLQHLSNSDVAAVVPKLSAYPHVVVTEHIPIRRHRPNIDMPTGPWTRLSVISGVDIAEEPFNFRYTSKKVIAEVAQDHAVIRTTHYTTR